MMNYLLENEETERILFRRISRSDYKAWVKFFEDPITSRYWVAEWESPEVECAKWYDKQIHRYENNLGGMNALIDRSSGKLIGHCGLLIQIVDGETELEIGYSLLPEFWGNGYATEAAIKCRDFAFQNDLSSSIISIISVTNKPSEKVALRNGMGIDKETGYKGNLVNVFRIRRSDWKLLNNER